MPADDETLRIAALRASMFASRCSPGPCNCSASCSRRSSSRSLGSAKSRPAATPDSLSISCRCIWMLAISSVTSSDAESVPTREPPLTCTWLAGRVKAQPGSHSSSHSSSGAEVLRGSRVAGEFRSVAPCRCTPQCRLAGFVPWVRWQASGKPSCHDRTEMILCALAFLNHLSRAGRCACKHAACGARAEARSRSPNT